MRKTSILLLIVMVAVPLVFGDFVPWFEDCGNDNKGWVTTSVSIDQVPKRNTKDGIKVCGTVLAPDTVKDFTMKVKLHNVPVYKATIPLTQDPIYPGDNYCYNYTYPIPSITPTGQYNLTFDLEDTDGDEIGCTNMGFEINSEDRFLKYD